jgi:ATP-dependent helicase/DNAse subunit B
MTVECRIQALKGLLKELDISRHLRHDDARVYGREARALRSLFEVLDDMERMERFSAAKEESLRSFASKVRLLCSSTREGLEPRYEGAVLVTGLRSAMMSRFDHVFIIGMVEGDIPDMGAGNPFISEEEVARFGLLNKADMLRQERLYFHSALLAACKSVWLSCHSSSDGKMVVSSSFYDEFVRQNGPPGFPEIGIGHSRIEQQRAWGEAIAGKRDWKGVLKATSSTSEELLRRANVESFHRVEEYDSPYDGVLTDPAILEDLANYLGPKHVFSPTELDTYASCPQRFYLERVLRLEPKQELETEVSGKDQGTFVHQVAFRLFSEARRRGIAKVTTQNIAEMEKIAKEIAEEELAQLRFTGPAYEAFRARMAGSAHRQGLLSAFLNFELSNTSSFAPTYFELSFGRKLPEDCDPISRPEPVTIELAPGEPLLLAGRVDRVDMRQDGKFYVVDYKTGELPAQKDVREGRSLQVQLYLQAIERLLPGRKGIGGVFYRVKSESEIDYATIVLDRTEAADLDSVIGRKTPLDSTDELVAQTNLLILEMLRRMRRGAFHPAIDDRGCKGYCEFKHVCRFDALRVMDMGVD